MPGPHLDAEPAAEHTGVAAELAGLMAALSASASGASGAIRVTVAGSGAVTGLTLDDRVHRLPGAELAGEILAAMRRAQAGLVDGAAAAVRATVGADTETGRAVLESFARRFPAEPGAAEGAPVMPSPPLLTFPSRPSLPHQVPGVGFASGRDSRAR